MLNEVKLTTNVFDLISNFPEAGEILMEYGIPCSSCHFSSYDTVNDSVKEFGLTDEDIEDLLNELNEVVNEKQVVQ